MKEKKEGVIRLEETSKALMEEVLKYLFTGHVDINEDSANLFDLMAAADYFVIPSLKTLCGKGILETLALSNCVSIYYFALKFRCEGLQKGLIVLCETKRNETKRNEKSVLCEVKILYFAK